MSAAEAVACLRRGDLAGAEAAAARALQANERDVDALNVRAMVRHQRGDLAGAIEALNGVLAVAPNDGATLFNRATLLHQAGRLEEAVHAYARALAIEPRDVTAWVQRSAAERALGRWADVARSCMAALEIDPNNAVALNEGAAALGKLGRFEEALELFERLVKVSPDSAPAHTNRGKTLAELGRLEEACDSYRAAIRAHPNHAPAWNNLGVARVALGDYTKAIEAFESASLGENQNFDAGHPVFNRATTLLLQGDYANGFAFYAQRFSAGATNPPPQVEVAPQWRGERLDGLLRIRGEQGVGDQLLFTRLLPLVFARTDRVALDCDPRLAGLLQRAYPQLEAVLAPSAMCEAAAHIPMGDIPGVLQVTQTDLQGLPAPMRADPGRAAALRSKYLQAADGRPVIGIAWASPRAKMGRFKGASLEHWGALLSQPYFFVSLQYGDDRRDIAAARSAWECELHHDDSVDQMRSIEDFAAQLAALDHIVTISNTTAHVAGALGLNALVLAPPAQGLHWYWGVEGAQTPWYPSLRLIRRARDTPWDEQIEDAAARLAAVISH